jgi:hypothetical protein
MGCFTHSPLPYLLNFVVVISVRSGGGQKDVETLENKQPCSFSSGVKMTGGTRNQH